MAKGILDWQDNDAGSLRTVRRLTAFAVLGMLAAACGLGITMWQVADSVDRTSIAAEQQRVLAGATDLVAQSGGINAALLEQLSRDYQLHDLRADIWDESARRASINLPGGATAAPTVLSWAPELPGRRVLLQFAPTRAPMLLLIAAGVVVLLYHLNRLAGQLHRQRQLAQKLAGLDPLTGVANRLYFDQALAQLLAGSKPDFALYCLDLDGFKLINDRLGHAAGDAVLQGVAARLQALAEPGDIVVRLGGDEFALLRRNGLGRRGLSRMAEAIMDNIERAFTLGEKTATVGVSIGIATAHGEGQSASALMALADSALYRAKSRPGSAYNFAAVATEDAVADDLRPAA